MILTKHLLLLLLPLLANAHDESTKNDTNDVICHGDLCYPRVFVATDEFMDVYDDQIIPKGLHVRMNFETGKREAKINVPSPNDELANAVVVHPEESYESPQEPPPKREFKPPRDPGPGDATTFATAAADLLFEETPGTLEALLKLEDLVHEGYWGAQIAPQFSRLAYFMEKGSSVELRSTAAIVMGSASSNNPKAVEDGVFALGGHEDTARRLLGILEGERVEKVQARIVFALSHMLRHDWVAHVFVEEKGLSRCADIMKKSGDLLQGKIAVMVEDVFVDAEKRADGDTQLVGKSQLKNFCGVMQDVLVKGMKEKVEAEKVFLAMAKMVERGICYLKRPLRSWASSALDEKRTVEELRDNGEVLKAAILEKKDIFEEEREL